MGVDDDTRSAADWARPGWSLHAAFLRDVRADVRWVRDRRPRLLLGRRQVRLLEALQRAARALGGCRHVDDDGADDRLDGLPGHAASINRRNGRGYARPRGGRVCFWGVP